MPSRVLTVRKDGARAAASDGNTWVCVRASDEDRFNLCFVEGKQVAVVFEKDQTLACSVESDRDQSDGKNEEVSHGNIVMPCEGA